MRTFRGFIACAVLGCSLFGLVGARAQSNTAKLLLAKAQTLERRGRIDLAAKVWAQVLLADPNDTQALAGMVRYSEQSGKGDSARSYLDRLHKIDPNASAETADAHPAVDPRQAARLNEAGHLAAQQNPDAAMRIYREVLGSNPPEGDLALAYYELSPPHRAAAPRRSRICVISPSAILRIPATHWLWDACSPTTSHPHGRREESRIDTGHRRFRRRARDAWRQALIWEHGNPAYEASLHTYLSRFPDPDLEKQFGPIRAVKLSRRSRSGSR